MTAEENLPQQPDEASLLHGVPRLNGAADFALWQYRLKLGLDTLDATYWNVLLANSVPHDGILEPIPPRAEVIQYMSEVTGITPETVPREEVDRYIDKHFLKPNAEVKVWLAKDNKVRSLLMHTLEDHVKDRVAHTTHAFEAYNILKNLYRAIAPNIISKWTTWLNCIFDEDAHPESFIHGWDAALKDLLDTFGQDAVSVRVQVCQFISAVTRQRDDMHAWVRHLRVDLDAPDALDRVRHDFIMDQGQRVDPDYFGGF